jgi:hypothetical protein
MWVPPRDGAYLRFDATSGGRDAHRIGENRYFMNQARLFLFSLSVTLVGACGGPGSTGLSAAGGRASFAAGRGGEAGTSAGDVSGTGGDPSAMGGTDDVGDEAGVIDTSDADTVREAATSEASVAATSDATTVAPRDATAIDAPVDATSAARDASADAPPDAQPDAPSDANTRDVVTTATCNATPQQDSQCFGSRPPHRYVCPISLGTPDGCQRIGTASTTASYCCP